VAYELEGKLLEVCDCKVLCPCWIGEDSDNGTCDAVVAYHFEKGKIDGVDVAGLNLGLACHIPANIMQGNWEVAVYVDSQATDKQQEALIKVWTGQLGGPVADMAKLVGKVVSVEKVPISFQVAEGKGTLKIGTAVDAEMAPYKGAGDRVTTLNDSVFSTIPGSPAYVSKASHYRRKTAGMPQVDLQGHNAIQGTFRFVC